MIVAQLESPINVTKVSRFLIFIMIIYLTVIELLIIYVFQPKA
jgi:hypothetical protein